MGSKSTTIFQLFFNKIFFNKIDKWDQMPLRRVDLHMLKYIWFNFQANMLILAWEIHVFLENCRTGEEYSMLKFGGKFKF